MKKIYTLKIALMFLALTWLSLDKVQACVDYHPVPPPLTVRVDSSFNLIEITVHELNIFAGTTGDFCTCALSNYSNIFDFITYVAFVDSGTTNPVNGFAIWSADMDASNAWDAAVTSATWDGFVAEVITTMTPGSPVELIVRAILPSNYVIISDIDSALNYTQLG